MTGIIIGTAGLFIGVSALEFTKKIETARLQPLLEFQVSKSDNQTISILNLSPSPAYIKSFSIRDGDGQYTRIENWNYNLVLDHIGFGDYKSDHDPSSNVLLQWLSSGSYLGPEENYYLFKEENYELKSPEAKSEFATRFEKINTNMAYMIEYCDVTIENCKTKVLGNISTNQ